MRTPITPALMVLGAAIVATSASPAMATESMLFSQTASSAQVTPLPGHRADVLLHTGHGDVVAFEERPGRRTATLGEDAFTGLWRGTFRTDSPNAVITGRGAAGTDNRAVVQLLRASRVGDGVRYRVKVLRGGLSRSLAPANMTIDNVPLSAITAPRLIMPRVRGVRGPTPPKINAPSPPAPISVHLTFPHVRAVIMPPMLQGGTVQGAPLTLSAAAGPTSASYALFTFYSGGQVVVTGNPGAVTMSFALDDGQACALPQPLTWSTQVTGTDGSVATYGPGDALGASTFTATVVNGTCFLGWGNLTTPPPRGGVTYSLTQFITSVEGGSDPIDWPSFRQATISAV